MNKFFKITFCALGMAFSQVALSTIILEHRNETWRIHEHSLKEAVPQIISDETVIVNSTTDCDHIMIVLYENKLKIYYSDPELAGIQEVQDSFNDIDFNDIDQNASYFFSNTNDPIFHAPIIDFDEIYYSNTEHCFINVEESVNIENGIIECPHIELKSREIKIESFLIGTQTIEFQSNNPLSLLSSIKFTIKNKANFKWQSFIAGSIDFSDNFTVLACLSASKVELQCLPGSFYLDDNAICFNNKL